MRNLKTTITDDQMMQMLAQSKGYSVIILHRTDRCYSDPGKDSLVREHGRRNFQLKAEGLLSIVCAIRDDTDVSGVGIFNTSPEEAAEIYNEDPGVKAGIFTFEVHPCSSFPGDALPK